MTIINRIVELKIIKILIYQQLAADLRAAIEGGNAKHNKIHSGQLLANAQIVFEKAEGSTINLIGKSKG